MDLMHIPLCELSIAKTNVRHGVKKADYEDLVPSIQQRGILQPLLVRKNGKGYEIVAGRRRYLAVQSLEKEGLEIEAIPCAIMAKGDDAAAVEASLIENVHRLPMDDMDQFEAFQRLLKEGRTIEEIANTFGVTEIMVKRRLAIANLSPKIRTAYRAEEIDGETLRALTIASKQQQKDWLLLFEDPEQHAPRGGNLKRWLLGGSQIPTSNALFDLANCKGEIVSDLFGEESYFANPDTFWPLQNEAIAKLKASFEANGWTRVEVMEQNQRFHDWDYEKTSKKKGGAVNKCPRSGLARGQSPSMRGEWDVLTQLERLMPATIVKDFLTVQSAGPRPKTRLCVCVNRHCENRGGRSYSDVPSPGDRDVLGTATGGLCLHRGSRRPRLGLGISAAQWAVSV